MMGGWIKATHASLEKQGSLCGGTLARELGRSAFEYESLPVQLCGHPGPPFPALCGTAMPGS